MTLNYEVCLNCQKRYHKEVDYPFHEDAFNNDWYNRNNFWCARLGESVFHKDTWEYANLECPYVLEHIVNAQEVLS
jgi:hypothetical protein